MNEEKELESLLNSIIENQKENNELVLNELMHQNINNFVAIKRLIIEVEQKRKIEIELAKIFCRSRIGADYSFTPKEFDIDCSRKVNENEILKKAISDGYNAFTKK